jgi:hypothetical protein
MRYSGGPSSRDTWTGSLEQQYRHTGEYVTLSGFDMVSLKADTGSQELDPWRCDMPRVDYRKG